MGEKNSGKWLVSRKVASCPVRSLRLRKGYSLACLVFNLELEKVKSDSDIQRRGKTFYKPVQLLAFADCTDIIWGSGRNVNEYLWHLNSS
jgi:hypothetical protein